ncbi:isoaspartyl peptidase/L-asparaginase family protein [Sphingomonas sp. QA11]|uniref:isoaspartyl peptidase/L-asparaginase family protein n=1 Tax=Sphingomonas sp. QA11 TaxID=2950605 RepID=UPI002349DA4A|nr:isoaspartyl peptidase/L-asparaginase family protein [Sphingomonas sp. QA11]WCM25880.1 isoaspartyl peptidase/L-asparaginase family protein [Sphingomonas sp. QA11]
MAEALWSIAIHGGARTIAPGRHQANRDGCLVAVGVGAKILRDGGTALDAAEQAVRTLENDLTFNAGSGSVPTSAGTVELDAAMMDGATLDVGAVAALSGVRHPVSVARLLLTDRPVLLVGDGARAYALEHGVASYDVPAAAELEPQHDTVGCVALDQGGNVVAATSTGGLLGQLPGRVGDAPILGCGFYADNQAGAVAISGDGESILRVLLATRVVDQLGRGSPTDAIESALARLGRVGGEAGIIALDTRGRIGVAHNSDHFAVGIAASWLANPVAAVLRTELQDYLND